MYLDGQGCLAHAAVAQHHQLVKRHLPRHGVGVVWVCRSCAEMDSVQETDWTEGQGLS